MDKSTVDKSIAKLLESTETFKSSVKILILEGLREPGMMPALNWYAKLSEAFLDDEKISDDEKEEFVKLHIRLIDMYNKRNVEK